MSVSDNAAGAAAVGPAPGAEGLRHEFERRRAVWAGREARRSWARLFGFVAILAPWATGFATPAIAVGLSLAATALFVLSIRAHLAAQRERELADRLLLVLTESERRAGGRVECIRSCERPADDDEEDAVLPMPLDRGETWRLSGQECDDLDLFAAPVGVFGLLNRTSTAAGARRLRDLLERLSLDVAVILRRQLAVRWLAENVRPRLHGMAALAALRLEGRRLSRLIRAIAEATPLRLRVPGWLLHGWSAACTGYVGWAMALAMLGAYQWSLALLPLLGFNSLLLWLLRERIAAALHPWRDVGWAVRGVRHAAEQALASLPGEGDLGRLRSLLKSMLLTGALRRIERRAAWAESGGMAYALVNAVTLSDVHAAMSIARSVLPHREALLAGVSALADLEALYSLACFAAEQPVCCYPEPEAPARIEIEGGVHPLIAAERVVGNAVALHPGCRLWLITGSNMAGKSTFLRMVGLCVLLAQAGSAVTARRMRWSPARLITDLRARDNLSESESYFLSEVRHLRRLVLPPEGRAPILGLVDEPFRGTNSRDQSAASVAVLEHLLASPHLFLVATHDRHLTGLCDGRGGRNFHFRENLSADGLVFDYRLHEGPARTRNALSILEREGYPPELVRRAREWPGDESDGV